MQRHPESVKTVSGRARLGREHMRFRVQIVEGLGVHPSPWDPTVGLRLGPYRVPRGLGVSCGRDNPVSGGVVEVLGGLVGACTCFAV